METGFMQSIMKDLNANLAVGKRTLCEMIDSGDHTYKVRDGSIVEIPEAELRLLWDVCDDQQRLTLRLPIYVSTDVSGESSAWKVEGCTEAAVVAAVLGKKLHKEGYLRLYYPDLSDLRAKIPDSVMIVFSP